MTTYRLTLVDRINQAEPPKVIYVLGATRELAEQRAKLAAEKSEIIVDLVPLD